MKADIMEPADAIVRAIGEAATLEQLAEECAELGQAALKLARIIRSENPTPVTREEGMEDIEEEMADVMLCMQLIANHWPELDIVPLCDRKEKRWTRRIQSAKRKAEKGPGDMVCCGTWPEGISVELTAAPAPPEVTP